MSVRARLSVKDWVGPVVGLLELQDRLTRAPSKVGMQSGLFQVEIVRSASSPTVPKTPDRPMMDAGVARAPALRAWMARKVERRVCMRGLL